MTKRLIPFLLLILSPLAWSQVTLTASSGVTSSNGILYAQGTYSINLVSSTGQDLTNAPLTVGGVTLSVPSQTGKLSATATFTINLPLANSAITSPTGTQYRLSICSINPVTQPPNVPLPPQVCFTYTATFNSSTDLSTILSALAPPIQIPNGCPTGASGTCTISGNLTVNGTINKVYQAFPGTGTISATYANMVAAGATGTIHLACGTYFDNVIITTSGTYFVGDSNSYPGSCVTVFPLVAANPVYQFLSTTPNPIQGDAVTNQTLLCPNTTACGDAIQFSGPINVENDYHFLSHLTIATTTANQGTSTYGFNNGINWLGRNLSTVIDFVNIAWSRNAGLYNTSAGVVQGLTISNSNIAFNYGYGMYFASTAVIGLGPIELIATDIQFNYNTSPPTNCAGLYLSNTTDFAIFGGDFEHNCNSTSPGAAIRLTGTYNQNFTIRGSIFNLSQNEWGIFNDTTQTTGDYDSLNFTGTTTHTTGTPSISYASSIYVATSNSSSNVHIGSNYSAGTPAIIADTNGITHVSTDSPIAYNVGVSSPSVNPVTSNTISAGIYDHLEVSSAAATIKNITGGYNGRRLSLLAVTTFTIATGGTSPNAIFLGGSGASEVCPVGSTINLYYDVQAQIWAETGTSCNPNYKTVGFNSTSADAVGPSWLSGGTEVFRLTEASAGNLQLFADTLGSNALDVNPTTGLVTMDQNMKVVGNYLGSSGGTVIPSTASSNQGPATGNVQLATGCTTGSIGGGALTAGTCATGTCTVISATGHPGVAAASDGSTQAGFYTTVGVATTTATVSVCAVVNGTPTAKTYNVTVF